MKRRLYYLFAAGAMLLLPEVMAAGEPSVQGIPYLTTFTHNGAHSRAQVPKTDFIMPDPGSAGGDIGTFTLDSIKNWSGEGSKRAGLVIQWNTGRDNYALAFGYRFDGSPTGIDMLRCVVENNPQLYGLFQRTNVASGNEKFGYTINGLGWDANCSGLPITIIDTGNGNETYSSSSGFFDHPRGCSESVSYPDYDYDNWKAADTEDYWQAGWYEGYWSYWLKDGNGGFSYSGVGASGRTLTDGCWDGWNFCPEMQSKEWLPVIAVPSLVPEGFTEIFTIDGLTYKLKDAANAQLIRGAEPYSGEIIIPATVTTADGTFSISSIGPEAFANSEITAVTLPNSISSIGKKAFAGCNLTGISLPGSLTELKDSVFYGCRNLSAINFPPLLTEIPAGAYAETAITTLVLPSSVSNIQSGAFKGCEALTEIVFPAELAQLSSEAFGNCNAISKVTVSTTLPLTITESVFSETAYGNATLIVPEGYENDYRNATGWKNFANISTRILPVNVGDKFLINGVPMRITSLSPNTATVTYNHFKGNFRETAVQTANSKLSGELIVPEQITYMGETFAVTEIQPYAFYGASAVTKVELPANLQGFGPHVFDGCYNLTSVVLPDGITSIPDAAFSGCDKLAEIVNLPASVDTIGESAFYRCSKLTSFPFISEGLKVIGRNAFANSGLTSITIPASVDSIGYQAFGYSKLTDIAIPPTVSKLGQNLFYQCSQLTSATLPSTITEVPKGTFYNCRALTGIEIPEGVTRVDDNAFYGCSKLTSVTLPQTLTEIGKEAFRSASSLTQISLPENLRLISDNAFYSCKLTSLQIPAAVDSIGKNAFYGGAFNEVTYPANVTRTGGYTFAGCSSLTSVTFPDNLVAIPDGLFKDCKNLSSIEIPESCKSIGYETFSGCTLLDIAIPQQIENIGKRAFYNCKALTRVEMPSTITTVPEAIFNGCTALTEIIFAPGTKVIEKQAFYGCKALESMTLPATLDSIGTEIFSGCSNLREVTFPEGIDAIPANMFYNCTSLTTVNIGSTLTSIGDYAFSGCSKLTAAPLPESLTKLGNRSFQNCTSLQSVALPSQITVVPSYAFAGCSDLTDVQLSPETTAIDSYAFQKCKSLESIELPASVKTIGSSAFSDCSSLVPELPLGLEEIGSYAFSNCTSVTRFDLPESVKIIGGSAYQGCTALPDTILIPEHITSLGGAVFQGTNVSTVYVCDPLTTSAFDYTFRTISSWSNPVYCTVVVPFAHSEKSSGLTGYQNVQTLLEPELNDVAFANNPATADTETASLSAAMTPDFDNTLPERFLTACGKGFTESAKAEVIYSFVRQISNEEAAGGPASIIRKAAEENMAEAKVNGNGHFEASLENLNPGSLYSYKWRVSAGNKTLESEPAFFTTLNDNNQTNSIAEILEPTTPVEIYSLDGKYIGRYGSIADLAIKGVFIARQGTKTIKIAIK